MLILTMSGYSLTGIPKNATEASGTGAWFSLLLLALIFAVGSVFIAALNKKFEGKTIFEYSAIVFGKIGGSVVTVIYALYFSMTIIILCRFTTMFINSSFLPETPITVLNLMIIATSAYIGSRGITNIARLCEIYGIVFIIIMLLLHTIMLFFGDVKYIMPFFEAGQIKRYITGMGKLIVPFLGIEVMLAIPYGKQNRNYKSTVFFTVIFLGLFFAFTTESSVMIMGPHSIVTSENALIEALRETRIPMTFLLERPDLIFILVGISGFISTLSVIFHMVKSSISYLTLKSTSSNLMPIIAPLVYLISTFAINEKSSLFILDYIFPVYGLAVVFLIPIFMLITAKARKL